MGGVGIAIVGIIWVLMFFFLYFLSSLTAREPVVTLRGGRRGGYHDQA